MTVTVWLGHLVARGLLLLPAGRPPLQKVAGHKVDCQVHQDHEEDRDEGAGIEAGHCCARWACCQRRALARVSRAPLAVHALQHEDRVAPKLPIISLALMLQQGRTSVNF